MSRVVLFILLAVVAAAAAVLSFSALEGLALACGFGEHLAWLLPVVVDAGCAAGSVTWLSSTPGMARTFGRRLALILLGASVVGNAVGHVLEAYHLQAAWWLVVAVSGLAPGVLAATIHLSVVAAQGHTGRSEQAVDGSEHEPGGDEPSQIERVDVSGLDDRGLSRLWEAASPDGDEAMKAPAGARPPALAAVPPPESDPLLPEVLTAARKAGRVPSRDAIKTAHRIGTERAAELRRAALEAIS